MKARPLEKRSGPSAALQGRGGCGKTRKLFAGDLEMRQAEVGQQRSSHNQRMYSRKGEDKRQ